MAIVEGRCNKTPSGKKKAQMFIITTLFLIGLIFSVQQMIFQYTAIDLSSTFRENNIYLLQNTKNIINKTIRSAPDCQDFRTNMKELNDFLNSRIPLGGYSLSLSYQLDCSNWGNSLPNPAPLNLTLQIIGKNVDTSARMNLYHT